MSRLDQHVAAVQNKLALARFITALIWAMLVFAGVVTLYVVIARTVQYHLPHSKIWFWSGAGVATSVAMFWAWIKRPSRKAAAVAIDDKLGLREKISTALFVRNSTDPFAMAAVKDAERTAENVVLNYYQHFPIRMPKAIYGLCGMVAIALLVAWLFPNLDLFGKQAQAKQVALVEAERAKATASVKQALANVEAIPKALRDDEAIKKAQIDLQNMLKQPIKDPAQANRSALKALQDAKDAIKRQAENNSKFAEAQNVMKDLAKNITPPDDAKGPVADAQRKIAEGKFTDAFNKLDEVAKNFDKMDEKQKQEVAQQMQQMAKQMQQAANNQQQQAQKAQQQVQQLQQQLGMNQQQAQQMQQAMQQNQGNAQAQQQAMQQQMQKMGMNQQQAQAAAQQMQQAMQQQQAQANSQGAAGQMAQAAQQMAQAMQQASQGQQNAQGNQQMSQGMQAMQQQLQDLEAMAKDAAQAGAAQQQMQNAADQAAGNCNGQGQGGEGGEVAGRKDGANPWGDGDPQGKGQGMGGPGIGAGGRAAKSASPFAAKPEMSPSADNQKGRILASNYIKDNQPITGTSKETLKNVIESAQQQGADEVDNERIGNQSKSTVKKYFQSMTEDAK